ncbi:MAG: DUF4097 family beta strand repeat-containing protein [Pseudomonadota bacterium]
MAATSANAADKTLDRTFTVAEGGALIVEADSASVRVSGGDTNQVTVHMIARGSEADLATEKLDAFQKGDSVTVTMRRPEKRKWFSWNSWTSEERIEVTVPRRYRISVQTGGGSVELSDTAGAATLHTSGGSIDVRKVTGNVEARTSGGGIHADTIRGDVDADTSGGGLRLLNIDGKISGHTSGGSVHCSLVGINRGISALTSGGEIELILPRATTATIDATTSGGGITTGLPVSATIRKDDRLEGTLNGGGQPIEAHTSGGGISLRAAD